jgi:hypothetical protein
VEVLLELCQFVDGRTYSRGTVWQLGSARCDIHAEGGVTESREEVPSSGAIGGDQLG